MSHTLSGNCFLHAYKCTNDGCRPGEFCDVCHQHSSPRGQCEECLPCQECEKENEQNTI